MYSYSEVLNYSWNFTPSKNCLESNKPSTFIVYSKLFKFKSCCMDKGEMWLLRCIVLISFCSHTQGPGS